MAKLISVTTLRERLGYKNQADINAALDSALKAATLHLEGILNTSFDRKTDNEDIVPLEDYVWMTKENAGSRVSVTLANGYQVADSLTVEISPSAFDWSVSDLLDSSSYIVRLEEGLIYLDVNIEFITKYDLLVDRPYIRFKYESGLLQSAGVYKGVPDWLKEAAVFVAKELYSFDDEDVDTTKPLGFDALLDPHKRIYPPTVRVLS